MANPINTPTPPVTVEYDSRGSRATKTFTDAYAARRFYVAKDKSGKRPIVKKG
jgi:hypothetical protein